MYPFDEIPCQCRVFVIEDWRALSSTYEDRSKYLNITQQNIINGALKKLVFIGEIKSNGNEAPVYISYELDSEIFASPFMKAFEWSYARLTEIADGISYWNQLNI